MILGNKIVKIFVTFSSYIKVSIIFYIIMNKLTKINGGTNKWKNIQDVSGVTLEQQIVH